MTGEGGVKRTRVKAAARGLVDAAAAATPTVAGAVAVRGVEHVDTLQAGTPRRRLLLVFSHTPPRV